MIRDHWKKIGIDLIVQENERSLAERRNAANETQLDAWVADGSEHMFTFPDQIFPSTITAAGGILFAKWYLSNGKEGKAADGEDSGDLRTVPEGLRRARGGTHPAR